MTESHKFSRLALNSLQFRLSLNLISCQFSLQSNLNSRPAPQFTLPAPLDAPRHLTPVLQCHHLLLGLKNTDWNCLMTWWFSSAEPPCGSEAGDLILVLSYPEWPSNAWKFPERQSCCWFVVVVAGGLFCFVLFFWTLWVPPGLCSWDDPEWGQCSRSIFQVRRGLRLRTGNCVLLTKRVGQFILSQSRGCRHQPLEEQSLLVMAPLLWQGPVIHPDCTGTQHLEPSQASPSSFAWLWVVFFTIKASWVAQASPTWIWCYSNDYLGGLRAALIFVVGQKCYSPNTLGVWSESDHNQFCWALTPIKCCHRVNSR